MKRRDFIAGLAAAAAWPLGTRAQQSAMPVVGVLDAFSPDEGYVAAFRQGLEVTGYVEGQNVAIEFRWANTRFRRLPELAADLVGHRVAVIVASGPSGVALSAKAATSTIPIVIASGVDPVRFGLATSLSRPGGNITGVTYVINELAGKRLDLLCKLVPQAATVGYLVGDQRRELEDEHASDLVAAAGVLGRQVIVLECRSDSDFEVAFATLVQRQPSALVVSAFPLAFNNRQKIVALAALHKIPAVYPQSQYVYEGGLMSYDAAGTLRQVTYYVAQILKGAKPADLPIQRPNKFRLLINSTAVKALGLTIPPTLLVMADEVIE